MSAAAGNRKTTARYAVQNAVVCLSAKAAVKRCMDMGDILITTSTVRNAASVALPAERSLSVCRVSELLVPVSSVGYALPAMSRLLAYAETVRFMETAFPSVPIASARTR